MATGSSNNFDTQPYAILIIIDSHLANLLNQSAGCPFVPKLLPAPAPVVRFAGFNGPLQGIGIDVSVHQ
jgi:hypothetical protein